MCLIHIIGEFLRGFRYGRRPNYKSEVLCWKASCSASEYVLSRWIVGDECKKDAAVPSLNDGVCTLSFTNACERPGLFKKIVWEPNICVNRKVFNMSLSARIIYMI